MLAHNGLVGGSSPPGPTTQFPESLFTETLREKAALARPGRLTIFDTWSLAGGTGRNFGLVSGRKNSGPGGDSLKTRNLMGPGQVSGIGGSIQRGNRERSRLQCREGAVHQLRPGRAWAR
jgi:hypothetical protein